MMSAGEESNVVVVGDKETLSLFRMIGMEVIEARDQRSAEEAVRQAASKGTRLIIALKHVVSDESSLKEVARQYGATLLILPTKWARSEPINIEKLLAEALGLG